MRVLVVEDDAETAAYIIEGLKQGGHTADHVADGRDGLILATTNSYDVIVVDRMLPGLEGLVMVKTIRGAGIKTPVLFLTARGGIDAALPDSMLVATIIWSSRSHSPS